MDYLMGIDLGTSSVKTLIIDLQGNIKAIAIQNYEISIPHEGYAEQEPEIWWQATVKTIREALLISAISPKELKGIGLSGQMHGMVLIDEDFSVLRPAIIWCDQRTKSQIRQINETIGRERLGELTLNPIAAGFQLASLLWVKENEPQNYKQTYKVLLPKDYIRLRLIGTVGTDITDASSTLAFDTAGQKWSKPVIAALDLDIDKYPHYNLPSAVAGTLLPEVAGEVGLPAGTPVVFGGADQSMQAVGNGIINPGVISATIGTGGQIFTVINQPLYDPKLRTHTFCNAVPGTWSIMGASLSAGLSLRWLRDNILDGLTFQELDNGAREIPPGSEGLIFLPYLTGERTPYMDPYARGVFFGLTLKHNRYHMARAVMEGVVYALRDSLEIFRELKIEPDKIIVSGGGAKSRLWSQILADVTGKTVYVTKTIEQACTGAAIMAGLGSCCYSSLDEACGQIVKPNKIAVALQDSENTRVYEDSYQIFRDLYSRNKDLFQKYRG